MTVVTDPESCWPIDLACVPDWDELEDPQDPESAPLYTEANKELALVMAGQTLRMLTGYRVAGCPITVRPASPHHAPPTWRHAHGPGWAPVLFEGQWLNIACDVHAGGCGCRFGRQVRLGSMAGSVQEVNIAGVVLDPSAYRLLAGGVVVRQDGGEFPLWQDVTLPAGQPNTWSVTYTPGLPVDLQGQRAAGILAGEFVRACTDGAECRLPESVTQIARNGLTMTVNPGIFPDNTTGIREVDLYVRRVNPNKLASPSMAWSPDVRLPTA